MFARFDRGLQTVTAAAIIILMSGMTASILLGVFFRYFLNDALIWSEEVARYTMIWVSFLGASLAFRRGGHIAVEVVIDKLPRAARRAVVLLGQLGILFFLSILAWYGWEMTGRVASQTSAALRISMSWPYLALPVGAALMIYHVLVLLVASLRQSGRAADPAADAPLQVAGQKGAVR